MDVSPESLISESELSTSSPAYDKSEGFLKLEVRSVMRTLGCASSLWSSQ